ncbi:sulfotransferase domain protein [Desulfosarcina variabilis str. Montpellier]|uniref:sulfotransferase family protein n=1 Tax=Desulfosarcina variabilis TaxID=2300 RepID=UPI003AFAA0EC
MHKKLYKISKHFPDFFVVGAPRCGTTAICSYLAGHPDIYFYRKKEINYFSFDMNRPCVAKNLSEYLDLFAGGENNQLIGEGSVWYLYSKVAIREIMKHNPKAKIIIHLRNPIDWFRSWHAHRVFTLNEDLIEPEKAWDSQYERMKGRMIPEFCREPELLFYRQNALFGEQVKRAFAVVPKKQLFFVVYDDFKKNPQDVYEKILVFLDLESDHQMSFSRVHVTKKHRNIEMARLLKRPTENVRLIFETLDKMGIGSEIRDKIQEWNTVHGERIEFSERLIKKLIQAFENDVYALGQLIGRDLSHWLELSNSGRQKGVA